MATQPASQNEGADVETRTNGAPSGSGVRKVAGPVVLCVVGGLGERKATDANARRAATTPTLDACLSGPCSTTLKASGAAVGLPPAQASNGEVGNLVIGAGRIVPLTRTKMDQTLSKRKLSFNAAVDQTVRLAIYDECAVHLIGLISDGGNHSDLQHLFTLIDQFSINNVPVHIHAILDGHDTPNQRGQNHLESLDQFIEDKDNVALATIAGRNWAMDRSGRWERLYKAYQAIVHDKFGESGPPVGDDAFDVLSLNYQLGIGDASIPPTRIGDYTGMNGDFLCDFNSKGDKQVWEWTGSDVGMIVNSRTDRMDKLISMFTRTAPDFIVDDMLMDRVYPIRAFREKCLSSIAQHDDGKIVPAAFPLEAIDDTLGEVLAKHGMSQLRATESEKVPHVTSFFNGRRPEPFEGERRKVFNSPRTVDSYDQEPQMRADKIADYVVTELASGTDDFILVHFANADSVAHTGNFEATITALEVVDAAVAKILEAVVARGGCLVLTSDHGNCEEMTNINGDDWGGHTNNRVPFGIAAADLSALREPSNTAGGSDDDVAPLREGGSLCDVAPTILHLLGIEKPEAMTGQSLFVRTDGRTRSPSTSGS